MCRARSSRAPSVRPTGASWGRRAGVVPNWRPQLYDEILFNGATFGDLDRGKGPLILASATDISTGSRFVFNQRIFDVVCSDLNAVPLSRAAAASSAVPVVLSPVTINNYGGTCNTITPDWVKPFLDSDNPPRPAARAIRSLKAEQTFRDSVHRPYLHLVDGGVSDNVGMRAVLDALEILEALHDAGLPSPLDSARRIIVIIVNSLSSPPTNWDESETPPGTVDILLKAAGTPIDAFSYEAVELLRDTAARWQTLRRIRNSAAYAANKDPAVAAALRVPDGRDLRHRRVVPHAEGQGGTGLSESAADVVRAARRGRRSPARSGGNDHHGLARIQAIAEGRRRQSRGGTTGYGKSGDRALEREVATTCGLDHNSGREARRGLTGRSYRRPSSRQDAGTQCQGGQASRRHHVC